MKWLVPIGFAVGVCGLALACACGANRESRDDPTCQALTRGWILAGHEVLGCGALESPVGLSEIRSSADCAVGDYSFRHDTTMAPVEGVIRGSSASEGEVEIVPEPSARLLASQWRVGPRIACSDQPATVYFLHATMGYLSAYDTRGNLLWQTGVPDFVSIEGSDRLRGPEPSGHAVWSLLEERASIGTRVRASGGVVAAETRTGGSGYRQFVFDGESGRVIHAFGPWYAVMHTMTEQEIVFLVGDPGPTRGFLAHHRISIALE